VGTGTVIAIGYLGRRVAGERVGLLAAAHRRGLPVLIGADASLLTESLFGPVRGGGHAGPTACSTA
jgi:hypothetical protein